MDQPIDSSLSGERRNVPSGEKRKSDRSERREDIQSSKKWNSLEGLEHNVIDADDQNGNDYMDDGDIDIRGAVEACGQRLSSEVIERNSTPKSEIEKVTKDNNPFATFWEEQGMRNFGLQKNPGGSGSKSKNNSTKDSVSLSDQRKKQRLVFADEDNNPFANLATLQGMRNFVLQKNPGGSGSKSKNKSTKDSVSLSDQRKKQRLAFEKEDNNKGGGNWLSTKRSTPIIKTKNKKPKQAKMKSQRPKKSFSPLARFTTQRRTRSSSTPKGGNDEVITIDSSSDEDEMSIDTSNDASGSIAERLPRRARADGGRACIDAVRIAIGKKVFKSRCELSFQFGTTDPYILFSFFDKNKKCEHSVHLKHAELQEVKYFIADENEENAVTDDNDASMTMIAFRITPTEKNNFAKYSSAYHQDDTEDAEKNERRYISVEFRDTDDFRAMLDQMRQHPTLEVWCSEDSKIPSCDLEKYTKALLEDNRKERDERESIAKRTRSGGTNRKKKSSENNLLLVYPFDVDESAMSEAASGLKELGGDLLGVEPADAGSTIGVEMQDQSDGGDIKGKSSRTHHVTIQEDDKERLCPGEFLNDTLVDFWMRWMNRGESQQSNSSVHFFTSHFMTTLKDDGPESVSSWTAKKNIDIFKKKLIFIPVNADLHWSLCVVVNPGLIANTCDNNVSASEEHSFIFFMDSLKMHNKNAYGRLIREWLNCEWKRLGKVKVGGKSAPFQKNTIYLRSPKIPYQENGCDCGVFVCRYAYNLFMMRHQSFTWNDIQEKPPFNSLITKGPAFQFDMFDIARIREEIGTLIDNLSTLYLRMKEREKANEKAKRQEIKGPTKDKQSESSENASEGTTNVALEKEDTRSETTAVASNEDDGTPEGNMTETADESEQKENISQAVGSQNGVLEVAAPEKLAGKLQDSDVCETIELDGIKSHDI